jgi:hypothetical protein
MMSSLRSARADDGGAEFVFALIRLTWDFDPHQRPPWLDALSETDND